MSIRREAIIRCACDLYLSEGLDGFSMRKLAKCVGCTAPALYRHYESKEEVMRDVVAEAYRLFAQYLYRALEGKTTPDRFLKAGQAYVAFALEQPALYEVLYVPLDLLGIQPGEGPVADQACAVGQFWSDRVREMMDAGFLHRGDPHRVSLTLWAHGHGMVSLYHRGLLEVKDEAEFTALMGLSYFQVVRGIGTQKYLDYLAVEAEPASVPPGWREAASSEEEIPGRRLPLSSN
jgi:AcrR family transcriptional regulator